MGVNDVIYREDPELSDMERIREVVISSDFFTREEIDVAVELVKERLNKGVSSGYHFVFAEKNKEVIGYACFGPIPGTRDSFDIYWIAVRNDQRGQGLGKMILKKAEQKIMELGGKRIYIDTSSKEQYRWTRLFYEKCGYSKEAVLRDFYSPGDDKVIYVKSLDNPH